MASAWITYIGRMKPACLSPLPAPPSPPPPGVHLQSNIQVGLLGSISWTGAGAEQALQWLFEHEHDPGPEAALPGSQPAQPSTPLPSATSSPGIMGILRREEEIAARNDRCSSPPSPGNTRP